MTEIHTSGKTRYRIFLMIFSTLMVVNSGVAQIYLDSTATIEARVDDLLSRMTLDEKIGQMIQMHYPDLPSTSDITVYCLGSLLASADVGPVGRTPQAWADLHDVLQTYALQTRLKIPLIFGIDAVHGFGAMYGATVFPHNIGLGCTRNPQLVEQAAQITAKEMAATGIDWTFGPVVAVARNENWGRTYESFGEDPNLVKEMSAAAVRGFQGDTLAKNVNILACAKHFIGDGGTTGGINAGNTQVDEATLRAIHLPGYLSAIQENVGSIMVSQSNWNGTPCHGSRFLLTTLLKEELKFKGLAISDWNSFLLAGGTTYGKIIVNAINAGIDMAMMSSYGGYNHRTFMDTLRTTVNLGLVSRDRIDDAVRRILAQKFRLGLFEHPYANRSLLSQVGSPEHRQVARECVRQSLVVLKKKDGILPIPKTIHKIHMAGRHANNLGYQCGGWTITWQGGSGNTTIGTTIMQAVQQAVPNAEVTYSETGFGADSADLGIAVVGELPYAESRGDGYLSLDPQDVQTIRNLKSYNIPVIVILISGRPMIINPILHHCDALIAAWLPGTEGQGITDVLFGDFSPVGLLSQTWPKDVSQIPINVGDAVYHPLFEYGYGITSLNDSPISSPPEVYSASTSVIDRSVEISFNKKMAVPAIAPGGFSVLVNGITAMNISRVNLKVNDSSTIVLALDTDLVRGSSYTVSYIPGDILSHDGGHLAAFENLSAYNLLDDYTYVHDVPGKVEAEECFFRQNIGTASCSDIGGGSALTFDHNDGWADYFINVSQSGNYELEFRLSSAQDTGQIQLIAKGTGVSSLNLPVTGSWNTWQSVSTAIELSEGPQMIRVYLLHGGFRLNWMQLSSNTGVRGDDSRLVKEFQLSQNYPNPFNPTTTIQYALPTRSKTRLLIYNVLGQVVTDLVNAEQPAGWNQVVWNANVSSGLYFYRIEAVSIGDPSKCFVETKKLVLMK